MRPGALKELRIAKGYNMRQMSIALNLPYNTYVNYEKGLREVNSEILIIMSRYFGVSPDYLMGLSDDKTPDNTPLEKSNAPPDLDVDDLFVLDKYKRLSVQNRYEILKLMDEMWEEQEQEKSAGKIG